MDENLLLIAFIVFAVLILLVALVLRKMTVDDIISDKDFSSVSNVPFSNQENKSLLQSKAQSISSAPTSVGRGIQKPSFSFDKKNLNNIGKILSTVGVILIFAPLPNGFDSVGFGIAFIGYLLTRFTNDPKKNESNKKVARNSTVDTLRKLANKPEYREAMQILSADIANPTLTTDIERKRRALQYLRTKGVSEPEAQRNITIMAGYLRFQQKRN